MIELCIHNSTYMYLDIITYILYIAVSKKYSFTITRRVIKRSRKHCVLISTIYIGINFAYQLLTGPKVASAEPCTKSWDDASSCSDSNSDLISGELVIVRSTERWFIHVRLNSQCQISFGYFTVTITINEMNYFCLCL